MPRLVGENLAQRLSREDGLALSDALRIGCDLLRGLAAVHHAGVIHGDVKPSNLFVTTRGDRGVLLDFGLSRETRASATRLTAPGAMMGTPKYMDPRVLLGAQRDAGSDVYAAGLVFYEMLTGQFPFDSGDGSKAGAMEAAVSGHRRPLREVAPTVPQGVASVVDRLVSGRVVFSASEVLHSLLPYRTGL